MKNKIDPKIIKNYKSYLFKQKYKKLVLSTALAGALIGTSFFIVSLESQLVPKEIEKEIEVIIPKEIFSASELEKKANGLYFFKRNIYAAAVLNSFVNDHINSDFKITNSINGISDKELVAYDSLNDINVNITATDKYFSLEYQEPSANKNHQYDIYNFMYHNDRSHAFDSVSKTIVDQYGRLRVNKSSEINIYKDGTETNNIWYTHEISIEDGTIALYISPSGGMSAEHNGESLELTKFQYDTLVLLFEQAKDEPINVSYFRINNAIYETLAKTKVIKKP